jgi:hypothetical protein
VRNLATTLFGALIGLLGALRILLGALLGILGSLFSCTDIAFGALQASEDNGLHFQRPAASAPCRGSCS